MTRVHVVIKGRADRDKLKRWIDGVPDFTRVELKEPKRTVAQNDRLWASLTDISRQVEWHGQHLEPGDWKDMFTASLRKARVVPGIDPGSFVLLGLHTSDMSKDELSNLLELIYAFGAEHGVTFQDEEKAA